MASSLIVSLAVLGSLSVLGCVGDEQTNGRGFGDHFAWKDFQNGLQEAKETKRPLMLLIHKSWCGACNALKPKFAANEQIRDLSKHFVMVNVEDDEEPHGEEYFPDGGYIPRILFIDPSGKVRRDIVNMYGNPSYRYYYPEPTQGGGQLGEKATEWLIFLRIILKAPNMPEADPCCQSST